MSDKIEEKNEEKTPPKIEITISATEIEQLKAGPADEVAEKDRVLYHNKMVKLIESSIRKGSKNKDKEAFLGSRSLFDGKNPTHWQREVLQDIVNGIRKNQVKIQYDVDVGCITVPL